MVRSKLTLFINIAIAVAIAGGGAIFGILTITSNTSAGATEHSITTDINLNLRSILALSLANCGGAPDTTSASLTLPVLPTPGGTFVSNCQNLTVSTNAPGYILTARAENTEGDNSLLYLNPTEATPLPEIPSTSSPISAPATLSPDTWGFAVVSDNVNLSSSPVAPFISSKPYTANRDSNLFANLPADDTTIYQTDELPGQIDQLTFYYGTNATSLLLAGIYSTEITYTAVATDVPPVVTWCGTEDYECIIYTISTIADVAPGIHEVGTYGWLAQTGHDYDWDIYVDDQPITDCSGGNNCTGTGGTGINITVPFDGENHQIKILPHGNPSPGWGNAFAASPDISLTQIISSDAPLTTMAFSPKLSEDPTDASYMFGSVFYNAAGRLPVSLINTYKLPDTITNLSYFAELTYIDNLDFSGLSNWLYHNNTITDFSGFLYSAYEPYYDTAEPIDLAPLANWFYGNTSITNINSFMAYLHDGNTQITRPIDFTPLASWFSSNRSFDMMGSFLHQTQNNNDNLDLTGQIIFPNWMKTMNENGTAVGDTDAFYETFALWSVKSDDIAEPKFMNGTTLSSIVGGVPSALPGTYTGRTGIL